MPPNIEEEFYEYLSKLTTKEVKIYAIKEGTVCFPREPLIRVEGPLAISQLLETTLLTLVNYASLVATNAARHRIAAGKNVRLLEMGLRRAQGPDGALSASKYAFLGGFDGTSNVLAGKMYGIPVVGTHAHSFIMSYSSLNEVPQKVESRFNESLIAAIRNVRIVHLIEIHILNRLRFFSSFSQNLKSLKTGKDVNFMELCIRCRAELAKLLNLLLNQSNEGEFASFIAYAIAFPNKFIALVDTYDALK